VERDVKPGTLLSAKKPIPRVLARKRKRPKNKGGDDSKSSMVFFVLEIFVANFY
jgi:hypothetical protein